MDRDTLVKLREVFSKARELLIEAGPIGACPFCGWKGVGPFDRFCGDCGSHIEQSARTPRSLLDDREAQARLLTDVIVSKPPVEIVCGYCTKVRLVKEVAGEQMIVQWCGCEPEGNLFTLVRGGA